MGENNKGGSNKVGVFKLAEMIDSKLKKEPDPSAMAAVSATPVPKQKVERKIFVPQRKETEGLAEEEAVKKKSGNPEDDIDPDEFTRRRK